MGRSMTGFVAAGLVAAIGASALGAMPAGAAAATHSVRTVRLASGRYVTTPDTLGTSTGSAGYLGGVPAVTHAKLDVTVPTIDCSSAPPAPIFVQVFINGQRGNGDYTASGMYVVASCSGTTPTYTASLVVNDVNGPSPTVSPGDELSFSGTTSSTSQSFNLTDDNTAETVTDAGKELIAQNLQLTVQGGFSGNTMFAPFNPPIKYQAITLNGGPFATTNPGGTKMVDGSGNVMIRTSALSPAGTGFTLTYVSNT